MAREWRTKLKKLLKLVVFLFAVMIIFSLSKYALKRAYPLKYSESIFKYSREYNVDPYLVASVIKAESGYKPSAKSNKSAYGLMQITPDTGEWIAQKMELKDFTIDKLYDPDTNIRMGCWYINNLNDEFHNIELVLAAYNGGRGNVQKWLKNNQHSKDGRNLHYIPFKETDKYVKKVKVNYNIYKYLYGR